MKHSLGTKEIQNILSGASRFKTKNLSFKYLLSSPSAVAFSVGRGAGSAVLRNKLKRQSRALFYGPLFQGVSLHLLVYPLGVLQKNRGILEDFKALKKHLESNLNKSS